MKLETVSFEAKQYRTYGHNTFQSLCHSQFSREDFWDLQWREYTAGFS